MSGRWLSVDPLASKYPSLSPYVYVANNPIVNYDPDGRFIDTILDVGFLAYDVYDIVSTYASGSEVTTTQWAALGADAAATLVPFATGAGVAVRAASKVDDVVKAVKAVDKAAAGKSAGRLGGKAHRETVEKVANQLKDEGHKITGGGGKMKEEYLPGTTKGSTKGGNYLDVTATKDGKTVRVQVGKKTKSGQPVSRERKNIERIKKKKPDDELRFEPYNK